MLDGIDANWEEIMNKGELVKKYSEQIYSHMDKINSEMKKVKNDWNGESYRALGSDFDNIQTQMESFNKKFKAYAQGLNKSAEQYKKTEKRIDTDATSLVVKSTKQKDGGGKKGKNSDAKGKSSKLK